MNPSLRRVRMASWSFAFVAGILQAWSYRFYIEPDGVNYLDVAAAYLRGDWSHAVNGYWSPLYSWLFVLIASLFHPSAYWESTFLHLLNFIFYLLALLSFEFFFRRLTSLLEARYPNTVGDEKLPEWAWWVLGYTAFLLAALRLLTLGSDTPDMVLAVFLFLSAGLLIDLANRQVSVMRYFWLGLALGVAYLTKSVMFPLSFVYMLTAAFACGGMKRPDARVLAALAAFALVSCPWIVVLSRAKGHLTFGETGKVAYLNEVKHYPTGISETSAVPPQKLLHPVTLLFDNPTVYEYTEPLTATFPPWYDASYWYEGATIHFDVRQQFQALARGIGSYFRILSLEKEWIAGWLALAIFAGDWRGIAKRFFNLRFLWFPSLVMLMLYALVLVEPRYVAVAMATLWIATFAALPWSRITPRFGVAVVVAIAVTTGVSLVREVAPDLAASLHPAPHIQWLVSERLKEANLVPGDRMAVLGHTTIADYWAHLAGSRIVADVPLASVHSYWMASPEKRAKIHSTLGALGVRGVVSASRPEVETGWQPLGETGYFIQILPATPTSEQALPKSAP
jgi:hypothetical protein